MIEADALAYNPGSAPRNGRVVEMHTRFGNKVSPAETAIVTMWKDVISTYAITGLNATGYAMGMNLSDHGSFWKFLPAVPAVLLIEDDRNGSNSNWHTTADTTSTFNWAYYVHVTRTLVGLAAHQAQLISTS